MLAVLKTASCDYLQRSDPQKREERKRSDEVGAWSSKKSRASGVFAYEEVCESLGKLGEQVATAAAGPSIGSPATKAAGASDRDREQLLRAVQ